MTRFLDGPAEGVTLMLRRAPVFLRAVKGAGDTWDALDQLQDTPEAHEAVYVYALDGEPGWMHVCRSRGQGGRYTVASYRLVSPQPPDTVLRTTSEWREWTAAEYAKQGHGA